MENFDEVSRRIEWSKNEFSHSLSAPANRRGRIPFHRSGFTTPTLRATVAVPAVAELGRLGNIMSIVKTQLFSRRKKTRSLFVIAMGTCLLLSGCMSPSQESDWRWKQYNPEYRPPYPSNPDPFRPGIF
jgi:hypothetical protein